MITGRMDHKHNIGLYTGWILILFIVSGVTTSFFDGLYFKPGVLAWGLASINFAAALGSLQVAQRKALVPSMLLVFGGSGLRILVMISSIVAIMFAKKEWMTPFCLVLLECFIIYLIIEVVVIYKRDLLHQR